MKEKKIVFRVDFVRVAFWFLFKKIMKRFVKKKTKHRTSEAQSKCKIKNHPSSKIDSVNFREFFFFRMSRSHIALKTLKPNYLTGCSKLLDLCLHGPMSIEKVRLPPKHLIVLQLLWVLKTHAQGDVMKWFRFYENGQLSTCNGMRDKMHEGVLRVCLCEKKRCEWMCDEFVTMEKYKETLVKKLNSLSKSREEKQINQDFPGLR